MTCTCRPDDDGRRIFLQRLAIAGSATLLPLSASAVGFRDLSGAVRVDGRPARADARLGSGARIVTPRGGHAVFTIDGIAAVLGPRAGLELDGDGDGVSVLRLVTGALMSVFRPDGRARAVVTPVATAGIRGTGVYAEARGHRESYFCTCFGAIDLRAAGGSSERVEAIHHSARRVRVDGDGGGRIIHAERTGHGDADVRRAAELVSVTPFPDRR